MTLISKLNANYSLIKRYIQFDIDDQTNGNIW